MKTASSLERAETRAFYLCVSPWIVGFIAFLIGPLVYSLYISMSNMTTTFSPMKFTGLENYVAMVKDPIFWLSLENTVIYVALFLPSSLVIGLLLAVLLNQRIPGVRVFRTLYYLPVVMPLVAASVLWLWILNPQYGLINELLAMLNINGPGWLADPAWAKPAIVIMSLWGVGGQMVIYLAAFQGVPQELYEAAQVDGATAWQRFWRITIPLISPAIFYNLVLGVINSFQVFTQAFIMTAGGPLQATLFYVLYIFQQAFEYNHMGYAATLSWVLLAIILFLTWIQFKYLGGLVYYEGER